MNRSSREKTSKKTKEKIDHKFSRSKISTQGYTIMEAIIAIAVCSGALVMILGLYGMAIKTEMVSTAILSRSLEINSIADEINLTLKDSSAKSLNERVSSLLSSKYPEYQLIKAEPDVQANLYKLEIAHQPSNSLAKLFHLKVFWRRDESPVI